ncbi:MAG: alpha/beta fold hydrolase [Phycisphaerales bacterium]|jgi:pimeloyl-ACP methyl ester carboxylesterase|nr:alpha/beta fold hydrolase [Phycisphaerales bacterium]
MELLILFSIAATIVVILMVLATMREATRPMRRTMGWALGRGMPTDPGDVDAPFETWEIVRPNDVRLPVWDVPGLLESGPLLVMVHGWGRSRLTWLPHLEDWRRRSSRLIMIDLRGHGDAAPDGAGLGDTDVGDLVALLDRLDAPDEQPIVVIGRSLGATVAILAAAETDRIAGVVAVAPYETLRVPLRQRLLLRGLPSGYVSWLAIQGLRLIGRTPRSTRAAAARTDVPILVVVGDQDPISPPQDAIAIAEAAPQGRQEIVPGAGHGNHWDLAGDRLDAAVDRLIQDASTTSTATDAELTKAGDHS